MQLILRDQCTELILCLSQPHSDVQEVVCENCSTCCRSASWSHHSWQSWWKKLSLKGKWSLEKGTEQPRAEQGADCFLWTANHLHESPMWLPSKGIRELREKEERVVNFRPPAESMKTKVKQCSLILSSCSSLWTFPFSQRVLLCFSSCHSDHPRKEALNMNAPIHSSVWLVLSPPYSSHSSLPCLFRLGSSLSPLAWNSLGVEVWWLVGCSSLWEDSSNPCLQTHRLVPLNSS